jgi:hypothetical protein
MMLLQCGRSPANERKTENRTASPFHLCQDEMRLGQKNGCVRQWTKRGTRARQPVDQRYESAYVFGAVCPQRDTGAAFVLPFADTWAMQQHLDDTAQHIAPRSHAVIFLDNAGWHRTKKLRWPKKNSHMFIRARCPEPNPTENIWQYLRQAYLASRVFANYDAMLDAATTPGKCSLLKWAASYPSPLEAGHSQVDDYADYNGITRTMFPALARVIRSGCARRNCAGVSRTLGDIRPRWYRRRWWADQDRVLRSRTS